MQEKAIKICQSHFQQMQFALTLENIKESKKKKKCADSGIWTGDLEITILDWPAVGSSRLRILTGSLLWKFWVFIIKNVEFWSGEQVIQGVQPVSNTRPPTS